MKRPNFLFVMTDTQATNMVGCYSGKPLNTQNIDSLAAEGIRFNSAYTCSPVCTPARAGLFTGIYANQSGPVDQQRRARQKHLHYGALL